MKTPDELRQQFEQICPDLRELGLYTVVIKKRTGY